MKKLHIYGILKKRNFSLEDINYLLKTEGCEKDSLFKHAAEIKNKYVGNKVYLRGLLEFSNICSKDCYYCGIRKSNKNICRYNLSLKEIERACEFAINNEFSSVVLQCGELQSNLFTDDILSIIKQIKSQSKDQLRITLSCGEQNLETFTKWYEAGAERYLLRIETTNLELYKKIHPIDNLHDYNKRIKSLFDLKKIGYQVGTGVMIGLPFQTTEDLANDIIFMRDFDIDMCGMGPYIEHKDTPLFKYANLIPPLNVRYQMALKMIAVLRIVMKDINIASTTSLQAINPTGKRNALEIGANVIMPNISPIEYKSSYNLYQNKPGHDVTVNDEFDFSVHEIKKAKCITAFGEYGDALHYLKR